MSVRCASVCGTTWTLYVMWFVGKPVLDLYGHLGKEPEKSAVGKLIVSVCLLE